jgi:hypothetical protein
MDILTKREIERRLKDKGLSNRESKIMVSVLSDTLRDMQEAGTVPFPFGVPLRDMLGRFRFIAGKDRG